MSVFYAWIQSLTLANPLQQYDEWNEIWKTPKGETERFELYAKSNHNSALRVLTQLGRLSKVLFDVEELRKKYGLKPVRGAKHEV